MSSIGPYVYTGPIDHTLPLDTSQLQGKSVIITGGANGIGATLVRAFTSAGSFVTFGDIDSLKGSALEAELTNSKTTFVQCDITNWTDQIRLFDTAISNSPNKSCDIVIANAGISRSSHDSLWTLTSPDTVPEKPDLNIVDTNLHGTLYTWKLAAHYFRKQADSDERDRCFIITGSMVAWIDSPANWEYTISKYGLRGLMRTARRSSWQQGIRINYVAPCYVKSAIRSAEYEASLVKQGVEFAEQEDIARCFLRVACERTLNGHSLMIVPRSQALQGYMDVDDDDHVEEGYMRRMQETQLRIIKDRWVVEDYKGGND